MGENKKRKATHTLAMGALAMGAFVILEGKLAFALTITCPSGHSAVRVRHVLTGRQRGQCLARCGDCPGQPQYSLCAVKFGNVCLKGPGPLEMGYTLMGNGLFPPGAAPLDNTTAGVAGQPGSTAAAVGGPGPSRAAGAAAAAATADAGQQQAPHAGGGGSGRWLEEADDPELAAALKAIAASLAQHRAGRQQQQQQQQQQRRQQRQQRQQRQRQQPPAEPADVIVISDDSD